MCSIVPLYPWSVCSIMAQSRDVVSLSFLSPRLFVSVLWKKANRERESEKGERRGGCWGLDLFPAHPIKGIFSSKTQPANMCADICLPECCDLQYHEAKG